MEKNFAKLAPKELRGVLTVKNSWMFPCFSNRKEIGMVIVPCVRNITTKIGTIEEEKGKLAERLNADASNVSRE